MVTPPVCWRRSGLPWEEVLLAPWQPWGAVPTRILSAEARAVRIVVALIVGAALVYGATQLADSTNKQTQQFEREFGY